MIKLSDKPSYRDDRVVKSQSIGYNATKRRGYRVFQAKNPGSHVELRIACVGKVDSKLYVHLMVIVICISLDLSRIVSAT